MELRHYLQILRRRKWIIIITTAVTLLIVGAVTLLTIPVYSTSATVRIAQVQDRTVDFFDLDYTVRLINTYVELVRSRPFLEEANQRLELDIDLLDLAELVEAEAVPGTELLKITVEYTDPTTAMLIANTLGKLLVEEGEKLYSGQGKSVSEILSDQIVVLELDLTADRERLQALLGDEDGEDLSPEAQDLQNQIMLQEQIYGTVLDAYENVQLLDAARANSVGIVDPASIPNDPTEPNAALNLALGTLVGLTGGIGLAFLIENLDTAIYSPDDLKEGTQAPFLGSIPILKVPARLKGSPLLLQPNGKSSAAEAFRILRSNILTMDYGRPPRSILVTSVEEGAGKSTVLVNLAIALGQVGKDVVAVDSDLREPSLNRAFGLPNNLGLKNVIAQEEDAGNAIQTTKVPGVKVLTSGPLPQNPAALLGLPAFQQLVSDLANWADLVLLDSPPLTQFSDAVELTPLVDSVVLVVGRGMVSENQVQSAVAQLVKVGAEQVGIVFNRAEAS